MTVAVLIRPFDMNTLAENAGLVWLRHGENLNCTCQSRREVTYASIVLLWVVWLIKSTRSFRTSFGSMGILMKFDPEMERWPPGGCHDVAP